MLEAYKVMDELTLRRKQVGHEVRKQRLAEKYFPDEEEEGENGGDKEDNSEDSDGDRLEDLVKNDDDEDDGGNEAKIKMAHNLKK